MHWDNVFVLFFLIIITTIITPGIDTYTGYVFSFPAHSDSAKITIHRLTACLNGIPYSISSDQANHFTVKQVQQ